MRRRSLLTGAAGTLALLAVAGWRTTPRHSLQEVIIAVLHQRLSYMRMEPAGVAQFAADLILRDVISPLRLRTLGALLPVYRTVSLRQEEAFAPLVLHGEERITTLYLISSDFFQNGERLDREIRYLGYYDPLTRSGCSSPFARPVFLGTDSGPGDGPGPLPGDKPAALPGTPGYKPATPPPPPATAAR